MLRSRAELYYVIAQDDTLLPHAFIVVRVDGRAFTRFTTDHAYIKPNDARGLALMNQCAAAVLKDWGDIVMAFGESDEYSFVFSRKSTVFGRRSAKLATGIVSLFAASFVFFWPKFFPDVEMQYPPAFDARCVLYPSLETVTDYFKWRQVDTHINSLYNETFWALVQAGA
jgi:tRNA(His) guanylyltransferase